MSIAHVPFRSQLKQSPVETFASWASLPKKLRNSFRRVVLGALCACASVTAFSANAHATLLNYEFAMNGNGFSTSFVTSNTSLSRFFHGSGTMFITYDTVTEELTLAASSIGNVYGATAQNFLDFGNIIVANANATASITFTNIVPGINAQGLVGLVVNGATGTGTFTISDIGLGNFVTVLAVQSSFMSGADFASLPAATTDYADLVNLPVGIYWQYLVTSAASTFFNQVVSFSWYDTPNDVVINGINFGHVHADLLASQVPEPVSAVLLGFALVGVGAARRRLQ